MNVSDSERIARILENVGVRKSPTPESANIVIINVCSIRQSAVDRAIAKAQNLKKKVQSNNVICKIILTGCILEKDRRKFREHSNWIFKIDELQELPSILKRLGFKIKETDAKRVKHYLEITPKYKSNISICVPIMTGCNNFCAYCVVPHVRGREISRPTRDILCEIRTLVQRGIKEIWLLGQNVNSYTMPAPDESMGGGFAKLLKMVNDIEGDFWIRFTSCHPKDLSNEMIETFANCDKVTPYFNLPIQSGNDKILKAMNRPYSVKKYKGLIRKTRQAFRKHRNGIEKEVAVSTDIIVGFSGETKKHFKNTMKTLKNIKVAFAYISRYSPRPQTTAYRLKDNVSHTEKKQREKELLKIVEKSAIEFNKKFLNKIVEVLISKEKNGFYIGKTRHYQTIKIIKENGPPYLIGEFARAKVIKITPYGLEGKIQ